MLLSRERLQCWLAIGRVWLGDMGVLRGERLVGGSVPL
jgi:hypothetical protein